MSQYFEKNLNIILIISIGIVEKKRIHSRPNFYSSSKDLGVKMDRHPQQIKRERQDKKKHVINTARTSDMKTAIKRVLETTDPQTAKELYINAVSTIDKMVSKGNLKKNTAARRKSQITRHLNSLSA